MGGAARRARRGAAGGRGTGLLPPLPAQRAPLPRAPAVRARGEDPRREGAHRRERLVAAVRGADLRDRGRAAGAEDDARDGDGTGRGDGGGRRPSGSRSTSRSAACRCRPRGAAHAPPRRSRAALAPGLRTRAFLFNTLLADKATDDRLRRYPNWLAARNLANEASDESVQALIEAVRGRYEIARRWYRLKARLLGVERLADYDRMAAVTEDEVTFPFAQAREIVLDCYSSFSPELGELAKALLRRALHRRAGAPRQARRRVLRLGGPLGASLRAAQLHLAPARRADARARARPRRALRARRPAGRLPPGHAADARRDRLGVRRDGRLRAAARRGLLARPRAWRCWRRTSRTRSRRSSARSR